MSACKHCAGTGLEIQPEPGPGSIILDADGVVWRRASETYRGDFPWAPCYGGDSAGGYRWLGRHPYSYIAHPVKVLYDPSATGEDR